MEDGLSIEDARAAERRRLAAAGVPGLSAATGSPIVSGDPDASASDVERKPPTVLEILGHLEKYKYDHFSTNPKIPESVKPKRIDTLLKNVLLGHFTVHGERVEVFVNSVHPGPIFSTDSAEEEVLKAMMKQLIQELRDRGEPEPLTITILRASSPAARDVMEKAVRDAKAAVEDKTGLKATTKGATLTVPASGDTPPPTPRSGP